MGVRRVCKNAKTRIYLKSVWEARGDEALDDAE